MIPTMTTDMQAILQDAMRVIAESADELRAGCAMEINGEHEWPDAEDKAEYDRRVAVLESVRALASRPDAQADERGAFQSRVHPWMLACFGAEIAADTVERNHRFFEEAAELVQSCGMTASEAHQLVDYTWSRPVGEKTQEVGGVMVTLAALCLANGLDMHAAGETELARISAPETMAKIRAKQAAKPKHSPLPEVRAAAPQAEAAQGVPKGWTGNHEADSALIMLDRLDVSSDDDVRVDAISAIVRKLAAAPAPVSEPEQPSERVADMRKALQWVAGTLQTIVSGRWRDVKEGDRVSIGATVKTISDVLDMADAALATKTTQQDCPHGVDDGACGWCYDEKAASAPTLDEQEWPSDRDAAIQACALMILGICKTRPQEVWPKEIEGRIRYMLSKIAPVVAQPQVAEPKGLKEIAASFVDWELVERMRSAEEIDSEEAGMLGAMIDSQAREIEALRAILSKGA